MHADAQSKILRSEGIQAEPLKPWRGNIMSSLLGFPLESHPAGSLLLLVTIVLSGLYIVWRNSFTRTGKQQNTERRPPTEPYTLPLLGSLPFGYVFRPYTFVLDPKYVMVHPNDNMLEGLGSRSDYAQSVLCQATPCSGQNSEL
jgi:hypothetical protein